MCDVDFLLTPTTGTPSYVPSAGSTVYFKLEVKSGSTRTPQLWYNTAQSTGQCPNSIVYAAGTYPATTGRSVIPGLMINTNNTYYTATLTP